MNKRSFIKLMGKGAIGMVAANSMIACGGAENAAQETESRIPVEGLPKTWMWLRPELGLSDDDWKAKFDQMAISGVQAVLPQIFNSHFALFDLPDFPVKERLLERLIPLAHASGLQIHAWMWSMPCNAPEIIEKHPDWFVVNGKGESAKDKPAYVDYYKFLDACHPEVQEFVQARVEALGKIEDLDGIHLDYIRLPDVILAEGLQPKYDIVQDREYPEYDYSYSTYCREAFQEQTGVDPMELEDPSQNEAWRQFRYDSINNLVNGKLVPTAKKYDKTITAAVFPNWESVRQEWHTWDLDAFLPMLYQKFYNEDINWIGEEVKAALARLDHSKPVFSGLFIPHLSHEELKEAYRVSMENGASGICIFAHDNMNKQYWEALQSLVN